MAETEEAIVYYARQSGLRSPVSAKRAPQVAHDLPPIRRLADDIPRVRLWMEID